MELKNGNFHALKHEEGRLMKNHNGGMHEEYFIKDHLGNIRVRFEDSNEDGEIQYEFPVDNEYEESELISSYHYYPFGMEWKGHFYANPDTEVQRKRFNGKEYEEGLGLLDYGARYYDPVVARWDVVDPLAEEMPEWSTYNYTFNNPIRFIDPDGRGPDDIIVEGQKYMPGASPSSGSSDFVKETFKALDQIVNGSDKNAADLVTNLANRDDVEVNIISSEVKTEASVGIGVIDGENIMRKHQSLHFDTDRGLTETSTGKSFSPDVALVHELGHIQNAIDSPSDFIDRRNTSNKNWGNLEEKETILKYEAPYAKSRGMLQRTSYSKGYEQIQTINSTNAITPNQYNIIKSLFPF